MSGGAEEQPLVSVSNLSKHYCHDLRASLRYAVSDIARELRWRRNGEPPPLRPREFRALDDVSFELYAGQALGVVGANGAGKTTLLKVLYGLLKPDAGEVLIRGRVAGLIELGTGFNPILTGRENIAVNAALLGLENSEVKEMTEEVIEFSELEDAIDAPVRYYSSGMAARLAFSVAAHIEPEVLLVDEVLSVGDFRFQHKCVGHMQAYLRRGGALIFVSHNAAQLQFVCDEGLLLEEGRCTFSGSAVETITRYIGAQHQLEIKRQETSSPDLDPEAAAIEALVAEPVGAAVMRTGAPARIVLDCRVPSQVDVLWGFTIWTADGWVCVTGAFDQTPKRLAAGRSELTCTIPELPLIAGHYRMRGYLLDATTNQPLALVGEEDAAVPLIVESRQTSLDNAYASIRQLVDLDVDWS